MSRVERYEGPEPTAAGREAPAVLATNGLNRRVLVDRLVVVVFATILTVPGISLALGARPENLEARVLAPLPAVRPEAALSPDFFAAIDRFLADAMPLRSVAVRLHAALDYGLTHGSTNPDVLVGAGDWLFFRGEIQPDCRFGARGLLATVDEEATAAARLGIDLRLVVTPDKHTIYPEAVGPAGRLGPSCTDIQRPDLRAGIAARPATMLDLWSPLERRRASGPQELLYWHQDSHWTPSGAIAGIRELVQAEAPGTWNPAQVRVDGILDRSAELARLIGQPRNEPVPRLVVERASRLEREVLARPTGTGEGADEGPGERAVLRYRSVGPDPVVPGTTVFIYDSFFGIYVPLIAPWYADSIWIHVSDLRSDPDLVRSLPRLDRIVFQVVEREAYRRPYASILAPLLDRP